jgi:hypothetical protein
MFLEFKVSTHTFIGEPKKFLKPSLDETADFSKK